MALLDYRSGCMVGRGRMGICAWSYRTGRVEEFRGRNRATAGRDLDRRVAPLKILLAGMQRKKHVW